MRRALVLGILLASGAVSLEVAAAMQQAQGRGGQPAPMVVEADKLKDNLYVLRGGGGNTAAFITANGVVVVDTKLPGWGQPLLEKIRSITDKPVTTIINTHTHFDHTSGNVEFPATVEVITHENTKTYMDQANPVYGLQTGPQPNIFKDNGGKGMPTRTFKTSMTVGRGADRIDLHYFGRAHTGGDAFVVFPALRVMHVGDTFPAKDLPIMDRNNGGSGVEYASTLFKAAGVANVDTIINGHTPTTTTPADLKTYAEFVSDFVRTVQDVKRLGGSIDDVVRGWKTPAKYAGYATPQEGRVRADATVVWDETR
jgi:glyoxylase-like metal-dependent hydrolase (beta-lactamase superfamily II)